MQWTLRSVLDRLNGLQNAEEAEAFFQEFTKASVESIKEAHNGEHVDRAFIRAIIALNIPAGPQRSMLDDFFGPASGFEELLGAMSGLRMTKENADAA